MDEEGLGRDEVVIRATNNPKLQCNIVTPQGEAKMLPVLLGLCVEHVSPCNARYLEMFKEILIFTVRTSSLQQVCR